MSDFTALKTAIQNVIKQNGNNEITGNILQSVLLSVVNTMGDGAINDLVTALTNEVTNRTNAVGTEATARQDADTALGGRIDGVTATVDIINSILAAGYVYKGIATPSTNPNTPLGRVFYIATTAGTYTNFGNLSVSAGINILKYNGSAWSVDVVILIDDVPTAGSQNLVRSGGVQNELALGAVYDVSAKNPTAGPNNDGKWGSLSALLSDANLSTLIPAAYRKGGMSVKFVQSSDNKYIQYRLKTKDFSILTENWQQEGVDTYAREQLKDLIADGTDDDFDVSDGEGNVIVKFVSGHIKTKNFDSSETASDSRNGLMSSTDKSKLNGIKDDAEPNDSIVGNQEKVDYCVGDINGNTIYQINKGYIKTQNFNSESFDSTKESLLELINIDGYFNKPLKWLAIGDSFTEISDPTKYIAPIDRMSKGYIARVMEKIGDMTCDNFGLSGATSVGRNTALTEDVITADDYDLYTILLGTNDWDKNIPLGQISDFNNRTPDTYLGCMADMIYKIRQYAPDKMIIVMTPIHRSVYMNVDATQILPQYHDTYSPNMNGTYMSEFADLLLECCKANNVHCVDLFHDSQITPNNAMKFGRVSVDGSLRDMTFPYYPRYVQYGITLEANIYPLSSVATLYDGLHPSDLGMEIIARLLANKIKEVLIKG